MKKKFLIIAIVILVAHFCGAQINNPLVKKNKVQPTTIKAGKWETYLLGLIKKYNGNKTAIKKEISQLKVSFVTKKIVVCLSNGKVGGVYIDELIKSLSVIDQKVVRMGLEDLMEMGGIKKNETMLACMGGGGMAGGQHLTDLVGINLSGGTPALTGISSTNGGITSVASSNAINVYASFNSTQVKAANNGCRNAQIAGLTGGLGMTPPRNAGYRNAVNSAISKMENGLTNCDNNINPVADANNGGNNNGNPETGTDQKSSEDKTEEGVVFAAGAVTGIVGSGLDALVEPKKAAATLLLEAGIQSAGMVNLASDEESQIADFLSTGIDVIEGGSAVARGVAIQAGGEAGLTALGAAAAPLVVAPAVLLGSYSATRGIIEANDLDDDIVEVVGTISDFAFEIMHGGSTQKAPGSSNKNSFAPGEGGTKTCEDAKRGWQKFKSYCEANGWQTYECMSFVAHMNKCADPSLVNPGTEGSYTCSARNEADLVNACKKQCEAKKRIAQPGSEGVNMDCGCDGFKASLNFSKALSKKICEKSYDPNGATPCDKITPGGIGANNPQPVNPMQPAVGNKPVKNTQVLDNKGMVPSKKKSGPIKINP